MSPRLTVRLSIPEASWRRQRAEWLNLVSWTIADMEISDPQASRSPFELRQIPAIETLLLRPSIQDASRRLGRRCVADAARSVTAQVRGKILRGEHIDLAALEEKVVAAAETSALGALRGVINATGVILHTNLGRAPLAQEAATRAAQVSAGYSNLEYGLESGERGKRDAHFQPLLCKLLGAEAAIVVNNNAAAVFLALNTLASGAEVIVSRGEMVEIGGSFRVPDICLKSGALLREVGTTNRTRASDYEAAVTPNTGMLLRVHPSNFRITGFTERPPLSELVSLAQRRHLVLMEDIGSGCLTNLDPFGIRDEPVVSKSLQTGVDIVTFSGDKLMGGPQAGFIAGRRDLISKLRNNPLYRALRIGKLALAAIEATLHLYLREDYEAIPALRMIRTPKEAIAARAAHLAEQIRHLASVSVTLKDGESAAGGGSAPGLGLPTKLIAVTSLSRSALQFARALRQNNRPIIARVEAGEVVFDLRTVLDSEEETEIVQAIMRLGAEAGPASDPPRSDSSY